MKYLIPTAIILLIVLTFLSSHFARKSHDIQGDLREIVQQKLNDPNINIPDEFESVTINRVDHHTVYLDAPLKSPLQSKEHATASAELAKQLESPVYPYIRIKPVPETVTNLAPSTSFWLDSLLVVSLIALPFLIGGIFAGWLMWRDCEEQVTELLAYNENLENEVLAAKQEVVEMRRHPVLAQTQ